MDYVRILFTHIAVLQSFLSELPPGLVVCHDWSLLGDRDQASRIAGFISPNPEIAGLVESALMDTAVSDVENQKGGDRQGDEFPFGGSDEYVARLQKKLDAFEARYCGPRVSA